MRSPLPGSIGGPGVSSATLKPELSDAGTPYTCPAREPAAKSIHTGSSRTVNRASPGAVPKYSTSWREVVTAAPATSGKQPRQPRAAGEDEGIGLERLPRPRAAADRERCHPRPAAGCGAGVPVLAAFFPQMRDDVLAGAAC